MRPRVLLPALLVATLLVACSNGSKKLQGRWKGTTVVGITPDRTVAAQAFALDTEIIAQGDRITISTPPRKQALAAKYTILEEDKTRLVISTDKDGPQLRETFIFTDTETMRWDLGDGRGIVFRRQPK